MPALGLFRQAPPNCLDFVDALDGVEIVTAIEETFSITISEQEAIEIRNMGDLFDLVCLKHGSSDATTCLSGRAFRLVAEAMAAECRPVRPRDRLTAFRDEGAHRRWSRRLGRRCGLRLDGVTTGDPLYGLHVSALGSTLLGIAMFASLVLNDQVGWLAAMVAVIITGILFWQDYRIFRLGLPRTPLTLAELVRRSMGDNYRLLAERHGHGNRHDIWHALSGLARSQSGYDGPIDHATTFYTLRQAAVLPAR
ncbi:MAG: hypothetical protein AAF160_08460 [Pseudomonadota bacterium]